jgi:hypothetical protein
LPFAKPKGNAVEGSLLVCNTTSPVADFYVRFQ